jgi:preprotein translocase subunit SecG
MILPLAAVPFVMKIVMALWLISCLALVFIIMIQKGKGGGLSAAFGGAGGTSSLFGAKTGDFLTWVTIGVAGVFLFLAVIMGLYYRPPAPRSPNPLPQAPSRRSLFSLRRRLRSPQLPRRLSQAQLRSKPGAAVHMLDTVIVERLL